MLPNTSYSVFDDASLTNRTTLLLKEPLTPAKHFSISGVWASSKISLHVKELVDL